MLIVAVAVRHPESTPAAAALTTQHQPSGTQAGFDPTTFAGSHPSWATPANRTAGANAGDQMQFCVYLRLRVRAAVEATARAVSDPSSATCHSYLSADQVKARFAPSEASVASVKTWLASQGLAPGHVPTDNLFVETDTDVQGRWTIDLVAAPMHQIAPPTGPAGTTIDVSGTECSFTGVSISLVSDPNGAATVLDSAAFNSDTTDWTGHLTVPANAIATAGGGDYVVEATCGNSVEFTFDYVTLPFVVTASVVPTITTTTVAPTTPTTARPAVKATPVSAAAAFTG